MIYALSATQVQIAAAAIVSTYSAVMTCGILWVIKLLLGEDGLRVGLEDETRGLDIGQHGTRAYASGDSQGQGSFSQGSFSQGNTFDALDEKRPSNTVIGRLNSSEDAGALIGYSLDEGLGRAVTHIPHTHCSPNGQHPEPTAADPHADAAMSA